MHRNRGFPNEEATWLEIIGEFANRRVCYDTVRRTGCQSVRSRWSYVPPVDRFTHAGEHPADIGQNWDRWKRSFQYYVDRKGIRDEGRKRALLLHCAGPQVQEVFSTLPDTGEDFGSAVRALDAYFKPLVNKLI